MRATDLIKAIGFSVEKAQICPNAKKSCSKQRKWVNRKATQKKHLSGQSMKINEVINNVHLSSENNKDSD